MILDSQYFRPRSGSGRMGADRAGQGESDRTVSNGYQPIHAVAGRDATPRSNDGDENRAFSYCGR